MKAGDGEIEHDRLDAVIDDVLTSASSSASAISPSVVRLYWRPHCLEGDFDELLWKSKSRYPIRCWRTEASPHGVGVFTHLARDRKRCIDIEDIECLFYHTWSRVAPKRARSFAALAQVARICSSIVEKSAGLPDSSSAAGAIKVRLSSWLSWPET
jgi:hypothetical protein